jgi:hypothetical protein
VDHLGVVRHRETRPADRGDLSCLEHDGSAVDGLALHRDDPAAYDRLDSSHGPTLVPAAGGVAYRYGEIRLRRPIRSVP